MGIIRKVRVLEIRTTLHPSILPNELGAPKSMYSAFGLSKCSSYLRCTIDCGESGILTSTLLTARYYSSIARGELIIIHIIWDDVFYLFKCRQIEFLF